LDARSLQGDAAFPEILARMGATVIREDDPSCIGVRGPTSLAPIMADMSDMPDAAITLAVVASFAVGRSIIRGLRTLRVKESDRIAALQAELAKVGVKVETNVLGDPDAITINAPLGGIDCSNGCPRVEFDTYNDHRMAMGLSLIGLRRPNTFIRNPACVAKTYPTYWRDLAELF
jgi:3-phosphoshikimate 1-carboxyvinyltransferase